MFHLSVFSFLLPYWKDTNEEMRKVVLLINWKEAGGLAVREADALKVHFLQCLEEALRNWSLARPVTEHRRTLRSPAKAEPGGLVLLGSGGPMWVMEIRLL